MPSPATHLRAPLLWLLVPLMAGFTAARFWPAPEGLGLTPLAGIAVVASLAATWFGARWGWFAGIIWAGCITLAATLAGFVMIHAREPHLHDLADRPPREITLSLQVRQVFLAAPQARTFTGIGEIVATGNNDRELAGCRIYFSAIRKISVPPQRSGRYVMRGVIEPLPRDAPAAGFNDYLDNLGVRQKLTRGQILREQESPGWFQRFFTRTEKRLEKILHLGLQEHPAEDSLYVAMVLGAKAVLSADQQNAFMRSGTFHIFSISGLHVGVIAVALNGVFLLLRMPHRVATILTLPILWLYVQVTGGSSPAVRSLLMIAFLSGMRSFRLPGNRLAALVAAALATLLLDPLQLFSTGFQMSYSVVIALVVMGVPLTEKWSAAWRPFALLPKPDWRWFHHRIDHAGRWLIAGCAGSWVAFLASAASGIGYFQLFSPGSLIANLVIIPLSTFAIYSGFLSLLCGLVGLSFLSVIFNWFAALLIRLMDWLVQHGTTLPATYFPAHFAQNWMTPASIIAMTAVMLVGVAGHWSRRYGGYWPPVVLLAVILAYGVKFG